MRRFNLFHGAIEEERFNGPFRRSWSRVGKQIGGELIGGTLYELPDGGRTWPYHFHHANEEWLLVVAGEPTLRTPAGTRPLRAGDVVAFPVGEGGAHDVTGPGRVLVVSTQLRPEIMVYPESDKLGAAPGGGQSLYFRRGDAVDYYEGEL